ncbi:MAG TPA: gamma-glutamyl-gamma-aminobutyrate hydrolase family protein [Gemmatimonadales bacterium]|nr:gamma-glutamyl-gamma-aminobutyrate hydrolase family protein [Gemmatimonadales bacterium]
MNRPGVVAVTATRRTDEGRERIALNTAYARALGSAGLAPLIVPSTLDPKYAADVLARVDGLLLTGGEDVDPTSYHAARHPRIEETDPSRDALEIALIAAARTRGLPVLGICRGIQILNVAYGGTLYQDLPSERPTGIDHADENRRHGIRIAPDSLAHRIMRKTELSVNSRHHQAVRDLARGLTATAWADDGLVEAVEPAATGGDGAWMLGVQWHPEDDTEQSLFRGFARALSSRGAGVS